MTHPPGIETEDVVALRAKLAEVTDALEKIFVRALQTPDVYLDLHRALREVSPHVRPQLAALVRGGWS